MRAHSKLRKNWDLMVRKKSELIYFKDMATSRLPMRQWVSLHREHMVSSIGVGIIDNNKNNNIEDMV